MCLSVFWYFSEVKVMVLNVDDNDSNDADDVAATEPAMGDTAAGVG